MLVLYLTLGYMLISCIDRLPGAMDLAETAWITQSIMICLACALIARAQIMYID